jgi:hypothetical protein
MLRLYDIRTRFCFYVRTYTAYPLFERSRPRNVCVRFGRATASTVMNRHDSFDICMETTTLHAHFEGRPTNRLRKSCGSAKPHRQEKLRARALHDENGRGGPMMPPGCCSRFVWPTWSTSLLARAPIVVCSRGSQQKYCVSLSEKSWCDSSVCDEYTLFLLAKWLGFHLVGGLGPSSDQSAFIRA